MSGFPQGQFLSIYFLFPVNRPWFPVSWHAPNFLLKIRHFKYYNVITLEIIFSPLSMIYCCCLSWAAIIHLVNFPNDFAQCISCYVCSCLPLFGSDLRDTSLNALEPKRKQNRKYFMVFAGLQIVSQLEPSMLSQTTYNCLNLYLLLHGAQRSTRGISIGSPQAFSEYVFRLERAHGPPGSLAYLGAFPSPYSFRYLPLQIPLSQAFWSVSCLFHSPTLSQMTVSSIMLLNPLTNAVQKTISSLRKFQEDQNKGSLWANHLGNHQTFFW